MAESKGFYQLPKLPYGYADLAPFVSEALLKVHHDGHHQKYVNQANALLEKFDKARADGTMLNMKCEAQSLAFNVGGHYLHSLFWKVMRPAESGGGGKPGGLVADAIDKEFGSFERFQKEFTELANTVESSGWAAMVFCTHTQRPLLVQIKDHDLYAIPGYRILLVLDVWEHAYYLDYKNEKTKYTPAFWNVVNWEAVDHRLEHIIGGKKEDVRKAVPSASAGVIPHR
jgi:Fe-Mn family superoxide dismutase